MRSVSFDFGGGGESTVQLKAALRGLDYETQVQMLTPVRDDAPREKPDVHAAAAQGLSGSAGPLPHKDKIQTMFGGYDISNVQAHTDSAAQAGAAAMGANAYATGNHVAFGKGGADLHTAAHEAAHVVQQQAGVSLSGGVGKSGDAYEQHADAVADLVVQGKSAEDLLGQMAGGCAGGGDIQMREDPTAKQGPDLGRGGSPQYASGSDEETRSNDGTQTQGYSIDACEIPATPSQDQQPTKGASEIGTNAGRRSNRAEKTIDEPAGKMCQAPPRVYSPQILKQIDDDANQAQHNMRDVPNQLHLGYQSAMAWIRADEKKDIDWINFISTVANVAASATAAGMLATISSALLKEFVKKTFEAVAKSFIDSVASKKPRSWSAVEGAIPMGIAAIANRISDEWKISALRENFLYDEEPTKISAECVEATRSAMRSAFRNQLLAAITTWSNYQAQADEGRTGRLTIWVNFNPDGTYDIQRSVLEGAGESIAEGLRGRVLSSDTKPDGSADFNGITLNEIINTPNPPDIVVIDGVGTKCLYSRPQGGIVTPRGTLLHHGMGRWGVKKYGTGIEPFVYAHLFVSEVLGASSFSELKLEGH